MYRTEAIILKKDEWNEADLLVTALAERFGKIRLLAQGVRKHGAKLRGHLEPYSLSQLSFVVGRQGYRLISAELMEFFANLRRDISSLAAAAIMTETLDGNLFEERDGAERYFGLLTRSFRVLDSAPGRAADEVLSKFHMKFLELMGVVAAGDDPADLVALYGRAGHTVKPPRAIFLPDFRLY